MSDGDERERRQASREAKQHLFTRPATAPSHEADVARYLGAQHYREQKRHKKEEKLRAEQALADTVTTDEDDEE